MRSHKGMRPHDVVILLKIVAKGKEAWFMKEIAYELGISSSEISESLNRSVFAGLLASDKKRLMKKAFLDFLLFGFRYVFPQQPGRLVLGMPTSHSASPLINHIQSNELYVWPYIHGKVRGQLIQPLHPNVPQACQKDAKLYELLSLSDSLRVGRARERNLAEEYLRGFIS
ncbi:MAG: hypothetical protein AAF694_19265 [Bacteroidota bacterium]